ncbi:MAG: 4Fe-4S binding protein [Bilophila wadsworthia]
MINVIDQDKCIGCGTCFKSCSLDVFRLDTDQSKVSPCMAACPAGTDIRGYNALVQQGKLEEAAQKLRQANPFPGITGRICFHPCEKECARNAVDGAVNINAVEQFLGDLDLPEEQPAVRHTPRSPVGSGPAGLSCACFMAAWATPSLRPRRPRGMLRYGIPAYRPPDAVSRRMWLGLKFRRRFRCNTRIGKGGDRPSATRRRGYAFLLPRNQPQPQDRH